MMAVFIAIFTIVLILALVMMYKIRKNEDAKSSADLFNKQKITEILQFPVEKKEYRTFTPSVFTINNELYTVARVSNANFCNFCNESFWDVFYTPRLKLKDIENKTIIITPENKFLEIDMPAAKYKKCQKGYEDFRSIVIKDILYIIGTGPGENCKNAMYLGEIQINEILNSNNKIKLKRFVELNRLENRVQKNWVPFEYDNKLFILYSLNPCTILTENNGHCDIIFKTYNNLPENLYNGTPLVKIGDFYYTVAHTKKSLFMGRLRYTNYIVCLNSYPPFNVIGISDGMFFSNTKKRVNHQYVSGLKTIGDNIYISYHENDCVSYIIDIPIKDFVNITLNPVLTDV